MAIISREGQIDVVPILFLDRIWILPRDGNIYTSTNRHHTVDFTHVIAWIDTHIVYIHPAAIFYCFLWSYLLQSSGSDPHSLSYYFPWKRRRNCTMFTSTWPLFEPDRSGISMNVSYAYLWVRQSTKLSKWPRCGWPTMVFAYDIFFSVFLTPCFLSSLRWKVIWRWCTSSAIRVISFSFPEKDLHRHRMIISSGDYQSYGVMITLFEGDAK